MRLGGCWLHSAYIRDSCVKVWEYVETVNMIVPVTFVVSVLVWGYVNIVGIFLPVAFHMSQTGTRHRSMTRTTCCAVPTVRARLLYDAPLPAPIRQKNSEQEVGGGGRGRGMRGGGEKRWEGGRKRGREERKMPTVIDVNIA